LSTRIRAEKHELEKRLALGRGKRPPWLVAAMKSGQQIEDFRIKKAAAQERAREPDLGGGGLVALSSRYSRAVP
jgi:hypothetical protein